MNKATSRALGGLLASSALIAFGALPIMMGPPTPAEEAIAALEEERLGLQEESQTILDAADEAGEDPSDEDMETVTANIAKIEALDKKIGARKALLSVAPAGPGRRAPPEPQNRPDQAQPTDRRVPAAARDSARGGFRSFGEFAQSVRSASSPNSERDPRLVNVASTYGNEQAGADGGHLVPSEFAKEIMVKVQAEENLLNRAAPLMTSTNSMTIPKDEDTPWGSGGVQVYWEGEAASITPSKPAFEMSQMRLVKLTALVPISDELLDDAVGLESWLRAKAPGKMAAKINTGFVAGTGVGQPLGILRSPSLVSVAKETSQAADTILFPNINKMWSRMYAPWRRNSIWLINQDIEPQLNGMAFDWQATAGKVPAYLPANGLSASPYATLMGRPVVPLEACSAIGDQGDIILVDMNQYWGLTKSGGIRTDTSIHLYFDQALTTFRFIFRLNGQPAWSSAITRENGTNTLSWAVTLDAR